MTYTPEHLSVEAFEELRIIAREELGEQITDDGVEDIGIRLLKLFQILATYDASRPKVETTESEMKALTFLQKETGGGKSPSIRDLSKVMGFRSSRSGFRLLHALMSKGLLCRDDKGMLHVSRV
jgi:hypothetical protein